MSEDRLALLDDPQLRPFLPLLYVAWSDGDLDATQRAAIASHMSARPWLRPAARIAVQRWLDPSAPPSPTELAKVRSTLRAAAGTLGPESLQTLTTLSHALVPEDGDAEATRRAADELATLLGAEAIEPATQGLSERIRDVLPDVDVDVAGVRELLDRDARDVREHVRRFLDAPERRAYGLPTEQYRSVVREWIGDIAREGVGKLAFPGVTTDAPDLRPFMVAFEMLALGDLSLLVKCGVQFGLFGGSIYFLGTDRHRALLHDVASVALPGCFAMSEIGHGSNVADLETVARYEHSTRELVIHTPRESARKDWIGGAARDGKLATVFAQLEVAGQRHGVHAILVPIRDENGAPLPGVRIGDSGLKMGLNGVDNGRLWFDHVRVPASNLLDRFAHIDEEGAYQSAIASPGKRFFTMLGTLVGGRLCVGSAGVSVAKSALAIAVRYAFSRHQFGPSAGREVPLMVYPTHQRRLLPALAKTYVLSVAYQALRERYVTTMSEQDPDTRELEADVAGLKAIATWHATETVQRCREACGGQGYLAVNRLPDLKADSDVFATFEGDNTVLLQLVAKSLLSGFGKRLEDGGAFAVVRMLGQMASTAVREKNPITRSRTDREHLRDRNFHRAALAHRVEVLVRSAAMRMRRRLSSGMNAHDALLEVQEHMVAAAVAHVERIAFDAYADAIATVRSDNARQWLDRLGDLYALQTIDAHMAWYLEDGYLDGGKARGIRKEVEALCREIAPAARKLVDAFGIPDACLAAPIAFFDPALGLARDE